MRMLVNSISTGLGSEPELTRYFPFGAGSNLRFVRNRLPPFRPIGGHSLSNRGPLSFVTGADCGDTQTESETSHEHKQDLERAKHRVENPHTRENESIDWLAGLLFLSPVGGGARQRIQLQTLFLLPTDRVASPLNHCFVLSERKTNGRCPHNINID